MKRKLIVALFLIVAAALGWWAFWGWATRRAEAEPIAFIAQETGRGRVWACGSRRMQGFPKDFELVCDDPSVTIAQISGPPAVWRLKGVVATTQATRATSARVLLVGPATLTHGDLPPVKVDWSFLEIGLQGLPNPTRVSVWRTGPRLEAAGAPPLAAESVKASIDLASTPSVALPAGGARLGLSINALAFAPLAELIKTPTLNLETHGDLAQAAALAAPGGTPARLESWRVAGGRLDIRKIHVWSSQAGGPTIKGEARLGLDEAHRLAGEANLSAKGLDEIARAFGLNLDAAAVGGLLGGLLGGKAKTAPTEPGAIPMPLRFEKGAVWYGPLKTPILLPPIY
ncbi:MAG: DUF2125 domain-containing protein [Rhodoblastus sp.]|nr:MAG: DUF2125 domain-containing protein [Rhodoblastus sp.]